VFGVWGRHCVGRVTAMYCKGCAYPLLETQTRCPECGWPFHAGDETTYSHDPKRPVSGKRLLIGSILAWLMLFIVFFAKPTNFPLFGSAIPATTIEHLMLRLAQGAYWGSVLIHFAVFVGAVQAILRRNTRSPELALIAGVLSMPSFCMCLLPCNNV
jgi:hypothetical protein